MPCRSDYMMPIPNEHRTAAEAQLSSIKAELDTLTRDNDRLREIIIRFREEKIISAPDWAWVNKGQIEHRKDDLDRLEKIFRGIIADQNSLGRGGVPNENHARLGLVVTADPNLPLEPQLGFDPDSY